MLAEVIRMDVAAQRQCTGEQRTEDQPVEMGIFKGQAQRKEILNAN